MFSDGSQQVQLTENASIDIECNWSADGSRIAFESERDGNREIYVMDAFGGGQTNLTRHPGRDSHPGWSPDGSSLVFHSTRDGNDEIYVMRSDGSEQVRLTNHAASDNSANWSPDGQRIVFASTRDGNSEIYAMNADGSGQTRLTDDPLDDVTPNWTPDASGIHYARGRAGAFVRPLDDERGRQRAAQAHQRACYRARPRQLTRRDEDRLHAPGSAGSPRRLRDGGRRSRAAEHQEPPGSRHSARLAAARFRGPRARTG